MATCKIILLSDQTAIGDAQLAAVIGIRWHLLSRGLILRRLPPSSSPKSERLNRSTLQDRGASLEGLPLAAYATWYLVVTCMTTGNFKRWIAGTCNRLRRECGPSDNQELCNAILRG